MQLRHKSTGTASGYKGLLLAMLVSCMRMPLQIRRAVAATVLLLRMHMCAEFLSV
jgi:hypothetical protein